MTTFCYYSRVVTKLTPIFGFTKSFQIQAYFLLSQLSKSVVVAVSASFYFKV
ncbi:hypothetical protein FLAVO9AF_840017 [Flavobacterium sp. 9AF]|nr:hypothetical protein FLAVO9AF_840017 [Flavobacterium sp. 9AF]